MHRLPRLRMMILVLSQVACDGSRPSPDGSAPPPAEPAATDAREGLLEQYGETLKQSPDDIETRTLLAVALASVDRREEAIEHFREIVRRRPARADAHFNLANALCAQGEFAAAIPHYRTAVDRDPRHARAHNNLAVALKETGQLEEAHVHLRVASRLRQTSEDTIVEGSMSRERDAALRLEPLDQLVTRSLTTRQANDAKLLDPAAGGWESEVAATEIQAVLERLLASLASPEQLEAALEEVATDDVEVGRLRPETLAETRRGDFLVVRRESPTSETISRTTRGHAELARALTDLAAPLADAATLEAKVKIVRVDVPKATVTALVAVSAHSDERTVGQHATWDCRWARVDERWLLSAVRASHFEEAISHGASWFTDSTQAVIGKTPAFQRQLLPGLNHWLARIDRTRNLHVFARYGLAIGDADGDGLEDVYLCQPGGLPNRLFVQLADGTCEDRSGSAGVDWLDQSSSALFVDLDNDGDQDLAVSTIFGLVCLSNNGSGQFNRRLVWAPDDIDLHSLSAADYDGDGDLDLYLCMDFADASAGQGSSVGFVYHDANDGGANALLRNDIAPNSGEQAEWRFTNVTEAVGLDADNRRHSLAAAWEDYDNDGDPDLYVANDYGKNCLYRNDHGRFVNVAVAAGAVDSGSGMSVSWGDYDRDGWMDLYVGNMFSSAGSRITRQTDFQKTLKESTRALYRRFAKGNTLLQNQGDGTFRETSTENGVEMGRWAWSSVFVDIDNDGWDDLLVANGYITTEDTGDL